MANNNVQPIFILPEGTQRTQGKNAQRNNIMAARLVAETVRTTLGPKGMDKMIVDSLGDITVTNDGVTILQQMQIEHPAAKMMVEIAKTQENEIGDGTTTAVVIAGELLKNAEHLLDKEIHPTVIIRGYRLASEKALKVLKEMANHVTSKDTKVLRDIAMTAMTGKGAESNKEQLADIILRAITHVTEEKNGTMRVNADDIKIESRVGQSIEDSELIEGVLLDKERAHPSMPKEIKNAKIALIDSSIEIKDTETETKVQINDPLQLQAFIDTEERMLREMVERLQNVGATVVFCQKGIDDMAQYFLAKRGVYAVRRVKRSDMERLSRATGAQVVTDLKDLTPHALGFAATVEEIKVGKEDMTVVRGCKNPKAITILARGGTIHVANEIQRALTDAIGDVAVAVTEGTVVGGAGAPEMELSQQLRSYAETLSGREQLAVLAYAEAVEVIPRTLAENAGLDPIDVITELRSAHERGEKWAGIDVFTGKPMDSWKEGVVEPLKIKVQAIKSASEVAVMILRIDDVIAGAADTSRQQPPMDMGGMM